MGSKHPDIPLEVIPQVKDTFNKDEDQIIYDGDQQVYSSNVDSSIPTIYLEGKEEFIPKQEE